MFCVQSSIELLYAINQYIYYNSEIPAICRRISYHKALHPHSWLCVCYYRWMMMTLTTTFQCHCICCKWRITINWQPPASLFLRREFIRCLNCLLCQRSKQQKSFCCGCRACTCIEQSLNFLLFSGRLHDSSTWFINKKLVTCAIVNRFFQLSWISKNELSTIKIQYI